MMECLNLSKTCDGKDGNIKIREEILLFRSRPITGPLFRHVTNGFVVVVFMLICLVLAMTAFCNIKGFLFYPLTSAS